MLLNRLHDALLRVLNAALDLREEIIAEFDDTLKLMVGKQSATALTATRWRGG